LTATHLDAIVGRILRANVENHAIPYVEPGTGTYAHVELRDTIGVPAQADGGARIFIALRWSATQGRVASTSLRVFIEDEEGDGVDIDRSWRLGDLTSNVLNPKLWISLFNGSDPLSEIYQASVDDIPLLAPYVAGHGSENFNEARIFVATNNDSSQVPGGTADPENFGNIQYRSNYGWGSFTNQMKLQGAAWGNSAYGSQFTFAWDTACVAA
jgi:hypothetical protein